MFESGKGQQAQQHRRTCQHKWKGQLSVPGLKPASLWVFSLTLASSCLNC